MSQAAPPPVQPQVAPGARAASGHTPESPKQLPRSPATSPAAAGPETLPPPPAPPRKPLPWMLGAAAAAALAAALGALAWRAVTSRAKKNVSPAENPVPAAALEDRREAGRCVCQIEELLGRSAPPDVLAELSQLHRLGLALRYGMAFSREQLALLTGEIARLRGVMEPFAPTLPPSPKVARRGARRA